MASFVILNSTRLGSDLFEAGSIVDAGRDPEIVQRLQAARAVLVPTTAGAILAVADEARVRRRRGASLEEIDAFMIANGLLYLAPGASVSVFVFKPGGITAGNVFATWAELVPAVAAEKGPTIVFFDDSIAPCQIPAGTWALGDEVIFKGPARSTPLAVQVRDGAKVTGLVGIDDLGLEKDGATAFQMFTAPAVFRLWGRAYLYSTGVEILLMFNANPLTIDLHDDASFTTGNPVVRMKQPGGVLRLRAFDAAIVERDTISAAAGVGVSGAIMNAAAYVDRGQALVQPAGVIPVSNFERADREFYDDTVAPPLLGVATTQAAIDALKATAVPLSNVNPQAVGVTAPGTGTAASREDHVHAHGSQGGGSEHAVVIAGGANGFMTGADKTKLDGVAAGAAALGVATPQPIGTATPGTATVGSHEDHVHAHGNQGGGSEHAVVIAGGANGFMTGTDKTKLDGVATGATNTPLGVATPQPIGTATAGTSGSASHEDHVHAHGNQAGGSLHAVVINGGANGFMSGTDKAKLDTLDAVAVEASDVVLRPIPMTGGSATRSLATTYVGATFDVPRKASFVNAYVRLTLGTIGAIVRVTIYQQANGNSGTAALVATGSFTLVAGGAQTLTIPLTGTLVRGIAHVLIGTDTGTAATARVHTNAAIDLLNQNVPAGKPPVTFTTAIAVNGTPPATFDPVTSATASTLDVAPVLRLGA